ncbi:thioredoxin [Phormidesmis priestleyi ULC007]|uniref:Thioredoxin n=2 Tax=Phormidesmis priestleyi TaxID=268141 RepID=A0A2T1DEA0_9CYAN|nr:thioredoxin [Phormidesmis priestleyi ULC007]PZO51019.1 MAG: thioredoxin [Phormidesmis priestleyi]
MRSVIGEQVFVEEVLESSSPVLVHFWAPWCSVCRLIEPALAKLRSDSGEQVKLIGINADENLKLASSYRITTLPTVLLFQGGKLLHRLDSYQNREELRTVLQEVIPTQANT